MLGVNTGRNFIIFKKEKSYNYNKIMAITIKLPIEEVQEPQDCCEGCNEWNRGCYSWDELGEYLHSCSEFIRVIL